MPAAWGCCTGRAANSAALAAWRVAWSRARRAAGVLRTTMLPSRMAGRMGPREARRGESAQAPAVPTGSTAAGVKPAGGPHQTKGPKTLPVPVEPAGRARTLAAPQTKRAQAPNLEERIGSAGPKFPARRRGGTPQRDEPAAADVTSDVKSRHR